MTGLKREGNRIVVESIPVVRSHLDDDSLEKTMLASKAHQEAKPYGNGDEPIMIQFVKQLTQSNTFRTVIIAVIVLAGVLAGLETNASLAAEHATLLHNLNLAVVGIFLVGRIIDVIFCFAAETINKVIPKVA